MSGRGRLLGFVLVGLLASPLAAQKSPPRFLTAEATLTGDRAHELRWPVAVAAASNVEIAVADAWGSRLVIFSADTGGWSPKHAVSLPAPPLSLTRAGDRYVVSLRGAGLVAMADPDFELEPMSLPEGVVPGPVAALGDLLLIHDAAGGKVLTLDAEGRVRKETPVEGHVVALAAAAGGFFAAVADSARILRYGTGGRALDSWTVPAQTPVPAWPSGLAAEPGGGLLVADRHAGRILALDASGRLAGLGSRRGWEPGLLLFPAGMVRLPDGRLAVADQGNGRVQVFRRIER